MKICVCENLNAKKPLEQSLTELKAVGIEAVEIGCGGYPGNDHANADILLNDDKAFAEWIDTFKRCGVELAALSVHGNCVHPDKEVAASFEKDFRNAVLLAEKAGLDTIITFSGCPGDHPGAKYPNWVTCPWPDDFLKILDYQWNEVLIPYWKEAAAFAESHGVTKIALEMHPGFCVYNTETLLKLRAAVGPVVALKIVVGAQNIHHAHGKIKLLRRRFPSRHIELELHLLIFLVYGFVRREKLSELLPCHFAVFFHNQTSFGS